MRFGDFVHIDIKTEFVPAYRLCPAVGHESINLNNAPHLEVTLHDLKVSRNAYFVCTTFQETTHIKQ